jgi:hypothetical protein
MTKACILKSHVRGKRAPCHALRELPPEVVGVQGR